MVSTEYRLDIKYTPVVFSSIHSSFSNCKKDTTLAYKWYVRFFLVQIVWCSSPLFTSDPNVKRYRITFLEHIENEKKI